jgi:hypothetical protein
MTSAPPSPIAVWSRRTTVGWAPTVIAFPHLGAGLTILVSSQPPLNRSPPNIPRRPPWALRCRPRPAKIFPEMLAGRGFPLFRELWKPGITSDPCLTRRPAEPLNIGRMPSLDLDPGEVRVLLRGLPPRQELVYRLAVRGLCPRCRGDRVFRQRTDDLVERFRKDLPAVLKEADKLSAELTASVSGR